ncbi:MAG: aspartate carbamoyltransferase catalytic subunit [Oscillospiraceae bacterium]|nr:aspartate carbamoyltransferase catalytic subunit [Oscillospiraceae bacterium]
MNNLSIFKLNDLTPNDIENLLDLADCFKKEKEKRDFSKKISCNLFFENSTRTNYSFQVAQHRLGMKVISFNPKTSSIQKLESFYDTVKTFDSFNPDLLIMRCSENEFWKKFEGKIKTPIINAGDGSGNHPTQSLLDLFTIRQEFSRLKGLTVGIIGDISHSRVAHSNAEIMKRLGMKVIVSGPPEYMDPDLEYVKFPEILTFCDVIIMLRMQHERHNVKCSITEEEYNKLYGINKESVKKLKLKSIIMHPGPVNRGVEILDEFIECEKSRIFNQVENGVFVRMALIDYVVSKQGI